jgi:hypothetical protein
MGGEGHRFCTCMTSTISTAHRSQHFECTADGVENALCASFFFHPSLSSSAPSFTYNEQST